VVTGMLACSAAGLTSLAAGHPYNAWLLLLLLLLLRPG
jgi:hypothetical protein